jgi:hypothetical protein
VSGSINGSFARSRGAGFRRGCCDAQDLDVAGLVGALGTEADHVTCGKVGEVRVFGLHLDGLGSRGDQLEVVASSRTRAVVSDIGWERS